MSRRDHQRLDDILASAGAIRAHLERGPLDDPLVFDAVRIRLIEIGEAVRGLHPDLLAREPTIPWADIAGMRNHLTHRYFDTAHTVVAATIHSDLPPLIAAVERLRRRGDSPTRASVLRVSPTSTAMRLRSVVRLKRPTSRAGPGEADWSDVLIAIRA